MMYTSMDRGASMKKRLEERKMSKGADPQTRAYDVGVRAILKSAIKATHITTRNPGTIGVMIHHTHSEKEPERRRPQKPCRRTTRTIARRNKRNKIKRTGTVGPHSQTRETCHTPTHTHTHADRQTPKTETKTGTPDRRSQALATRPQAKVMFWMLPLISVSVFHVFLLVLFSFPSSSALRLSAHRRRGMLCFLRRLVRPGPLRSCRCSRRPRMQVSRG